MNINTSVHEIEKENRAVTTSNRVFFLLVKNLYFIR